MILSKLIRACGRALFAASVSAAALSGAPALAAGPTFEEAVELHDAGRGGDIRSTERAVEAFGDLVRADASDPLANAYLGSSYALLARDSRGVTNRIRYINRGLRHLDTAVALAPDNFVARLIRANVTANLPTMFGRADDAVEDMLILDAMFTKARSPAMADGMVDIYGYLSDLAPEAGDWPAKAETARGLAGK